MGALVHRNFPQSTILAAKQPADSTATAPGKVHTVLSGKDRGFWVHCPRRTQAQRSWAPSQGSGWGLDLTKWPAGSSALPASLRTAHQRLPWLTADPKHPPRPASRGGEIGARPRRPASSGVTSLVAWYAARKDGPVIATSEERWVEYMRRVSIRGPALYL